MGKEDTPPPPPPRDPPKFVPKPAPGDEPKPGWKGKGKTWGKYALEKAFVLSDAVGGRLNTIAVKVRQSFEGGPCVSMLILVSGRLEMNGSGQ